MVANSNLEKLAELLQSLTWFEMVKVAEFLNDAVDHRIHHEEPLDRDSFAQIVFELSEEIVAKAEHERNQQDARDDVVVAA